jgi:Flp pilus assembly protein TadB
MIGLRILYTAAVMTLVVWLLSSGRPLGGLVIVPLIAVWVRRAAESGRLTRFARRIARVS